MIKNILTLLFICFSYTVFAQAFTANWNTTNISTGSSPVNQITIPTNPAYTTYNYTVDWGDSNTDSNLTGNTTHTYATPGNYTISITGTFPAIYFNNGGDRNKIIEISNWGTIQWQTMENAFYGCENLNFDAISAPDLSQVTSLKNMFRGCSSFNGILNNWDVNTITDISGILADADIFNRPVSNWNTINVTDMSETFKNCLAYNEPMDNWNTASVTNMKEMFYANVNFNQNINTWDVSQVTDMSGMFVACRRFNQPLNTWNVSLVTDMNLMFFRTNDFNQDLSNWQVGNVTNMYRMFHESAISYPMINWDVSKVTDMGQMFADTPNFNQPINTWDVSSVTNMSKMFESARLFNQPLDTWDVSNVVNMSGMFRSSSASGNNAFNQALNSWNVSKVTNMSQMFENNLVFNQALNNWNVSAVLNMSSMFSNADAFNQPLDNWNVSNVTNMSGMFQQNSGFNQPLASWTTTSLTNISNMFFQATAFNQDISGWNTVNVVNMSGVFNGASTFNQNLATWNIADVTNMANMLSNSGLSQANYDNSLIGWAAQTVRNNVNLGALNLNYCDGRIARQALIDNNNWNITGDIINCSFVICTNLISPTDGDTNVPASANLTWAATPGATGYRVTVRIIRGGVEFIPFDDIDVGNNTGLNLETPLGADLLVAGDQVFVTIVPYNISDGPAVGCTEESFTVVPSWVNDSAAFKLTYDTRIQNGIYTTPVNQLRFQASVSGLTYNYSIDWGDDQFDNNVTGDIIHTYNVPGIYTVSIIGTYPAPEHGEFNRDSFKLISIDQWGSQVWQSMQGAFAGCENMEYNASDIPNLSAVTNMSSMFIVCRKFNGNVNNWNVSNVTNMTATFGVTTIFNQPLNNWDVSNVTNMALMFFRTNDFDQDISSWDTSKVTNMSRMFEDAKAFNQPVNMWNVDAVTTTEDMFKRTTIFNQPLNNWNVLNVTNMSSMFEGTVAFNQNLSSWNVSNVLDMSSMFQSAASFNQPINTWSVSKVTNMSSMFSSASVFNQPLNNWDVTSVTNMSSMFSAATAFNQNLNSWNVTNVLNMRNMFYFATAFNQPLNNWDVNSVVTMSGMFQRASSFNQPLNIWNVSAVANMTSMFEDAIVFNQPLSNWDVSSVTLMKSLFEGAAVFNQNINSWNVGVVTNMEAMLKEAVLFNEPLNNWNTGEVLTMKEMFNGASVFNQPIDTWNVSFVTTMEEMFRNTSVYNQTMNSWNVASVTTMRGMFRNATAFNSTIDSWNIRGVTTMEYMFSEATNFNQTINSWRVSNVLNMNYMFDTATAFNQNLDRWNLGTVTMRSMFDGATAYNQYLGDWNIADVTDMSDMLDTTALTRENYDNTLIAWSEQTLTPGVTLGAEGLPYCDALEERQSIIDNFGWTITDDVLDCPIPDCTVLISPLNGAVNVPVNTNLSWEPALFARGYRLTVISNPGNITVVNNETVNTASYEFATDFSGGETVLVTITPFNDEGDASTCTQESFTISTDAATVPNCTSLTEPLNNTIDVSVSTNLTWQPIANADGYRITIGTSTGGNQILDNEDVGNITTYDLINDLPENTEIFITVIPYNNEGPATLCAEENFTTEIIPVPPMCTTLSAPINGANNVPIDTDLSWNPVAGATGYLVVVGTTQGGIEIVNNVDVLNTTTYDIIDDLLPNRTYYVTIIPYNEIGDAVGCTEESIRTGASTLNDPPACTTLLSPLNNAVDVAIDSNISWNIASNTTGYKLTIGTASGGNDILATTDVSNLTNYDLATDLPEATTIFVTITPYNGNGDATSCTEESFTTETLATIPNCTTLTNPLNNSTDVVVGTNLTWTAAANATGYNLTVGTTSGGNDILVTTDVGNFTSYDLATNLPETTQIFVTITPYNTVGDATACTEESFTTETLATIPNCTTLTNPLNNATDV
ncbi:MAG: BspA family leucine-rich repeat surface protein, partial [Flavobacteriaceae bacterium]